MSFLDRAKYLLGTSEYSGKVQIPGVDIASKIVTQIRESTGGNLTTNPTTQLEWFLEDVDIASEIADLGDMVRAAQLCRAMRRDPVISGLLATKSKNWLLERTTKSNNYLLTRKLLPAA